MMRAVAVLVSPNHNAGDSLDSLLAARVLPRSWMARHWAECKLPDRLTRCSRDLAPDLAWRSYGDALHPLFVMARANETLYCRAGKRVIDVYFLDGLAVVYRAGTWAFDRQVGWHRIDTNDA